MRSWHRPTERQPDNFPEDLFRKCQEAGPFHRPWTSSRTHIERPETARPHNSRFPEAVRTGQFAESAPDAGQTDQFICFVRSQRGQCYHGYKPGQLLQAQKYQGVLDRFYDCSPTVVSRIQIVKQLKGNPHIPGDYFFKIRHGNIRISHLCQDRQQIQLAAGDLTGSDNLRSAKKIPLKKCETQFGSHFVS